MWDQICDAEDMEVLSKDPVQALSIRLTAQRPHKLLQNRGAFLGDWLSMEYWKHK